jgi:hypothetical protein
MKRFLKISLGMNVLLAGMLAWLFANPAARYRPPSRIKRIPIPRYETAAAPGADPAPAARSTPMFHWSQIESEDYSVYRDNLRQIGCPEATIYDILRADVEALFAQRLNALVGPHQNQFWQLILSTNLETFIDEKLKQLNALSEEKEKTLDFVVGKNWEKARNLDPTDDRQERLGFLSEEKQAQVQAIKDRFAQEKDRVDQDEKLDRAGKRQRRNALTQQEHEALAQVLSAEELQLLAFHTSPVAEHLRNRMAAFDPSEEEFRRLYEAQERLDAAWENAPANDQSRKEKQARWEADTSAILGPERFEAYRRSGESAYQAAYSFAQRYSLPEATVARMYDYRKAAETAAQQARDNQDLPPANRLQTLESIRQETEAAMQQVLGSDVFSSYQRYAHDWLSDLSAPKKR